MSKGLKIIIVALALVAAIPLACVLWGSWVLFAPWHGYERARLVGVPLTAADVIPKKLSARQNAAPTFLAMSKARGANQAVDLAERAVKHGDFAAASKDLDGASQLFSLAHIAERKPGLDFSRDLDRGDQPNPQDYVGMTWATSALALRAEISADNGKPFLDDLHQADHLGQLAATTPDLYGAAVSNTCRKKLLASVERIAARADQSPTVLADLQAFVNTMPKPPPLLPAIKGDCYRSIAIVRNAFCKAGPDTNRATDLFGQTSIRILLDIYTENWPDIKQVDTHPREAAHRLGTALAQLRDHQGVIKGEVSFLVPSFRSCINSRLAAEGHRQATLGMLAAMRYRLTHGKFPETLDQAGVYLTDPVNGQPLRYKRVGTGIAVYSVGLDGKDNGGMTRELRKATKSDSALDEVATFLPMQTRP